ncbi:MAG: hypothetical protein LDL39_06005 [Magnetospirillum sp.]|nr:hypothetical protein [Magnetospirillum sp.]
MGTIIVTVDINFESPDGSASESDFDRAEPSVEGLPDILSRVVGVRIQQDIEAGQVLEKADPEDWAYALHDEVYDLTEADGTPKPDYRDRLILTAALACAAVQHWDRDHKKN